MPEQPLPRRPAGPVNRRAFLTRMGLAAVAGPGLLEALAACSSTSNGTSAGPQSSPTALKIASPDNPVTWPIHADNPAVEDGLEPERNATLRLYNYADYIGPGVIKAFKKKYSDYNVNVTVSTFNDTDEALTKIRAGNTKFDIYFPSYDQIAKMVTARLIRPLNHSYITNIGNCWGQFSNPWYDGQWRYTVPYTVYSTGIGWRADRIKADIGGMPNPYDVFWDPKYGKKLAVIDDWHTAMAMVALRAGITNINTDKPADLQKIQQEMADLQAKTKPKVTITMYNDLPAGQLSLAQMWSGDVINAQYYLPKGVKPDVLAYWFPEDGLGMVDNDLMVLLKQGDSPVLAHHFMNFLLDAKIAAKNFGYIGYQPPQVSLDPSKLVSDGYVPANLETAVVKEEWFAKGYRLLELSPANDAAWHQIWQRFKAGA